MYSTELNLIKSHSKEKPTCLTTNDKAHEEWCVLMNKKDNAVRTMFEIQNDFGDEFTDDMKRNIQSIQADIKDIEHCQSLHVLLDDFCTKIVELMYLTYVGNCQKPDDMQFPAHSFDYDDASCFATKSKHDSYVIIRNKSYIFNRRYHIEMEFHYIFSNDTELTIMNFQLCDHQIFLTKDDIKRSIFIKFDPYESAEFQWMQHQLELSLKEFISSNDDIVNWEGDY